MGPKLATGSAFAMSGAVWLTGIALYNGQSPENLVVSVLGGYVALGSLVLGLRSDRLVSTLTGLWLVAVALVALPVVGATATPLGVLLGVVLGLIYGTVAFVAWVTFGLIGLRLLGHLPDPAVAAYRD
jgi:hypothetical protein